MLCLMRCLFPIWVNGGEEGNGNIAFKLDAEENVRQVQSPLESAR